MTRILLVDDSAVARTRHKDALAESGYEVVEAGNGAEGLAAARQGVFDLILVDMNMPVMAGPQMVRVLRSTDQTTPIFMLTSESLGRRTEEMKKLGINAWLTKPVQTESLLQAVSKGIESDPSAEAG